MKIVDDIAATLKSDFLKLEITNETIYFIFFLSLASVDRYRKVLQSKKERLSVLVNTEKSLSSGSQQTSALIVI